MAAQKLCVDARGQVFMKQLDFANYRIILACNNGGFMEVSLSKDIQAGLDAARMDSLRKSSKLRIEVDGIQLKVLRYWGQGFSLDAVSAPKLRGLVDLYDGSAHLFQCLIVAGQEESGEMEYEFKRATKVCEKPALDFERSVDAPVALIAVDEPT